MKPRSCPELGRASFRSLGHAALSAGTRSLFVQDVAHEAFVSVNERGTEAAAATAVVVGRTSAPERVTLTADRPLFVVIRDHPTGAVLFLGQVSVPGTIP